MTDAIEIKNVVASVRQKLKNWADTHNAVFDLVLQRYAAERFLYRLSVSSEVDRFTLKGAALFTGSVNQSRPWGARGARRCLEAHRSQLRRHRAPGRNP